MWIDFHTHTPAHHCFTLYNLPKQTAAPAAPYSIGIHPWWIAEAPVSHLQSWVMEHAQQATAIGECGLDKRIAMDLDRQRQIAQWHLELAGRTALPLILHCVKAHNELTRLIEEVQPGVPVVFHGFRGSVHLVDDLCRRGYYLGVGPVSDQAAFRSMVAHIPLERMTLETDDKGQTIDAVYRQVAEIKGLETDEILLAMKQNALSIFGAKFSAYDGS